MRMLKVTFYRSNIEEVSEPIFGRVVGVENTLLFVDDQARARYYDFTWNVYGDPMPWTGFKVEVM